MLNRVQPTEVPETKQRLLEAGVNLMRSRGYNATTVDDICAEAGVTKGGFFHYFKSKDEIAKAALTHFHAGKVKDAEGAPFRKLADPLERVFGRLDYVEKTSGDNKHNPKGCLIGMFAQELALTDASFRSACQGYFSRIAGDFAQDLAAAKIAHAPQADFDPHHLATLYVAIVQGSLLMAKAAGSSDVLETNIEQFRNCLQLLFGTTQTVPVEAT